MKYILTALLISVSIPATAKERAMLVAPNSCGFKEDVNLSVSFNFPAESFAGAKAKFDEKIKQVENYAKEQKITKFDMQNMNYNINSQNRGYSEDKYQLSGNMSYKVASFADGVKLAEFLDKQKFQVGLNANSYKNGNCAH